MILNLGFWILVFVFWILDRFSLRSFCSGPKRGCLDFGFWIAASKKRASQSFVTLEVSTVSTETESSWAIVEAAIYKEYFVTCIPHQLYMCLIYIYIY